MANRSSRIVIPVRAASYDGQWWGDYPFGNKPNSGAVLQADALGNVGAAGQLSTAIRLGGAAQDVAGAGGGLSSGIKLAAGAQDVASATASFSVPAPTYVPWLKSVLGTGTVGALATNEFNNLGGGVRNTRVSNDITGPFGESQIVKVTAQTGSSGNFGGAYNSSGVALSAGDTTWYRTYYYFPSSFCAGDGGGGDGDGQLKFLRVEFTNGNRLTFKLGGFAHNACALSSAAPTALGVATEIGTASNNYYASPTLIPRDQWVALQIKLVHGTTKAASSVEAWLGTTYLGLATIDRDGDGGGQQYPASPSDIAFISQGDYWNGDVHQTTAYYTSNSIFTKQAPNTLDSGGRAFIHPLTRISDFA